MKSKIEEMKLLSYTTENHLFLNKLKVHDYFRSLIPLEGEYIYPQFHGLPKIHKKPVHNALIMMDKEVIHFTMSVVGIQLIVSSGSINMMTGNSL